MKPQKGQFEKHISPERSVINLLTAGGPNTVFSASNRSVFNNPETRDKIINSDSPVHTGMKMIGERSSRAHDTAKKVIKRMGLKETYKG